jgi:hypothetical protein
MHYFNRLWHLHGIFYTDPLNLITVLISIHACIFQLTAQHQMSIQNRHEPTYQE